MLTVGHFWVAPSLCFKARLSAKPLIWKRFCNLMQLKLIFTRKVLHLASFRKWTFFPAKRFRSSDLSQDEDEFEVITLPNLPGWCWNRTRRLFSDSSWKKKSSVYVLRAKLIATAWISYREVQALVASLSEKISLPDWTKVDFILGLLQWVKDAKVRLKNAEMF